MATKLQSVNFQKECCTLLCGTKTQTPKLKAATFPENYTLHSYQNESEMKEIMNLITQDLSEPYSIYTYRYFINNWPQLCFYITDKNSPTPQKCIGAIVCKLDQHRATHRGYIAMLAIDQSYRKQKLGSALAITAINQMISEDCDEVVLEAESTNKAALNLYENLGFIRDKRLFRYYLTGTDAFRLKLWIR
eukprot:Sdes_comp9517_c0_seq1m988